MRRHRNAQSATVLWQVASVAQKAHSAPQSTFQSVDQLQGASQSLRLPEGSTIPVRRPTLRIWNLVQTSGDWYSLQTETIENAA